MGALIHATKDGDWNRMAVVSKLRQLMTEIEDEFEEEEEASDNLVLGFQIPPFAGCPWYQEEAAKLTQDLGASAGKAAEETLSSIRTIRVCGTEWEELGMQ
ncbi:unnamed protein product [Linum tenue]|uniref:Uncharacterized protein n=1 Tax=Linum tenue TaxID=586396 RepID=A0AAV0JL68_9ROSI|nr:unnamed protein product [Linum tenue]